MDERPVIIGFDGTPAAEHVIHEAAVAFAPRPAYVVTVWEAGRAFDLFDRPTSVSIGMPAAPVDVRTATALDSAAAEAAQHTAERGAELATDAGLRATGMAVADDVTVAATLIRVATEHNATAICVGSHGRGGITEWLMGSTTRDLIKTAPLPVLVSRAPKPNRN